MSHDIGEQLNRIERRIQTFTELQALSLRLQGRTIKELDELEEAIKADDDGERLKLALSKIKDKIDTIAKSE